MIRTEKFLYWLGAVCCWAVIVSLPPVTIAGEADLILRAQTKIMFLFQEINAEGIQTIENTLIRTFENSGYAVLDRAMVAQALRREADLLQLYEVEAAKQFGSRLGADIVVSGRSKAHIQEKTYSLLEGKKVMVSQANVSARAILVKSGTILVAENASVRKPFDSTGEMALEQAAEMLAAKLLEGIDRFLSRDTIDYRLVVFNVSYPQSQALQKALHTQVPGVQQVNERGFLKETLEFDVRVEKKQDLAFKRAIFVGLSELNVGRFKVVAREGEVIYLQHTDAKSIPIPTESKPRETPPASAKGTTARTERPAEKSSQPNGVTSPLYKPGYRKSWAVVIGINTYQQWPELAYAVSDAEAVAKRLKKLGFDEIILLLDQEATQQNILRVLGDELYVKTEEDDRVFIFYAGHGQTQDLPNGGKLGYIIPADGDLKNYYSTAISMRQLQDLSDRLRAKHIFYAMDSCFSGLLLNLRGEAVTADSFEELTMDQARQVLTAGSAGEQVVELEGHGLFTNVLLTGLDGAADLNQDGFIVASELYQFVAPRVMQESRNTQNPVFGRLGLGRGEFVFTIRN